MLKSATLVLTATLLPFAVTAQNAAAVASKVEGLVTVSQGQNVGLLEQGSTLLDGARVVTGSTGSTVLRLGANCEITLKPNQSVQVWGDRTCAAHLASIESIAPAGATQLASTGTPWLLTPTGLTTAAVGVGLVGAVARSGRSGPVSGQ